MNQFKTREQVLAEFAHKGISINSWARKHEVNSSTVRAVLKEKRAARIGESHKIAVLLGIKAGEIVND